MARVMNFLSVAGLVLIAGAPAWGAEGNADAGKKVFVKCAVCHGIGDTKKPIAPNLNNVIGRTAGTQPDYVAKGAAGYSKAMVAAGVAGLVWDQAQIAEYLIDPKKKVPGNKMAFPGLPKEQDRLDVAAYIATFSNN